MSNGAPAYTAEQWDRVADWLRDNEELVRSSGWNRAAEVASLNGGERFRATVGVEGWTPLRGLKPTAGQLQETARIHRIIE